MARYWRCPSCGATQDKGANEAVQATLRDAAQAAGGLVRCTQCGSAFGAQAIYDGQYDAPLADSESAEVVGAGGAQPPGGPAVPVVEILALTGVFLFRMGQLIVRYTKSETAPDATRVFLCHDYKAPNREQFIWETTIGAERTAVEAIHRRRQACNGAQIGGGPRGGVDLHQHIAVGGGAIQPARQRVPTQRVVGARG